MKAYKNHSEDLQGVKFKFEAETPLIEIMQLGVYGKKLAINPN